MHAQHTTHSWEVRLQLWAMEALRSGSLMSVFENDHPTLPAAYAACTDITSEHSRTFYLASALLPPEKRHAVRALYAFCRITDDIVDEANDDGVEWLELDEWRRRVALNNPPPDDLVSVAWADTQTRYQIPRGYVQQLIEGVARDMEQKRYATFGELAEYCYGVASTVGLMAAHIIGFEGEAAVPYAVKLGVALQLTNILRDVGEDWRAGRVYLPQDELADFGLGEDDIACGVVDARWRAFMQFQIARTRRLYDEAMPGIGMLDAQGRFAVAAAADLYRAILVDIEANDYDVFNRRAHVSTRGKLARLPGIWLRARRTGRAARALRAGAGR